MLDGGETDCEDILDNIVSRRGISSLDVLPISVSVRFFLTNVGLTPWRVANMLSDCPRLSHLEGGGSISAPKSTLPNDGMVPSLNTTALIT